jgi:hypothetical protein
MAKKRKTDHSHEFVVEESRRPAAYTVGNVSADDHQQQQQEYWQQDQQQHAHQQADGYDGNGYDYEDGKTSDCSQHRHNSPHVFFYSTTLEL